MAFMVELNMKFLTSMGRHLLGVGLGFTVVAAMSLGTHPTHAADRQTASAQWPAEWTYRLQARISGLRFNINARMEWATYQGRYHAKLRYSVLMLGHRTQTSHGLLTPSGLMPQTFVESTSRKQTVLDFDWKNNVVDRNQEPAAHPLKRGAQDPLSVFFETGLQLAQLHPNQTQPSQITVHVVGTRRAEDWTFKFIGKESLDLPAGQFDTLHWQRPAANDDAKGVTADIWFAPSLGYLPVRIRLAQDNGDVLDQQLSALR
jgi:hypothetical protein